MKRLLLPAIVATATALGASASAHSEPRDAQAQAAELLSRPHAPGPLEVHDGASYSLAGIDAHASAAALLSGRRINVPDQIGTSYIRVGLGAQPDAHAHAAALLKGSRVTVGSHVTAGETLRTTRVSERLSEHPAVLVAQTWSAHRIDPNTFIVAHPARLQLVAASPSHGELESAERLSRTSN